MAANIQNNKNKYKTLAKDKKMIIKKIKDKLQLKDTIFKNHEKIRILKESNKFKQLEGDLYNSSVSSESDSICIIPKLNIPKDICPKSIAWKCNLTPTFSLNNGNGSVQVSCDGDFRVNTIDRALVDEALEFKVKPAQWKYYKGPAVIPFNTEYLDIACKTKSFRERDHHNYHTQFVPKKKLNMEQSKKLKKHLMTVPGWEPLSILVVSLDSLSRAHAHRPCGLPKTMKLLRSLKGDENSFQSFLFNRFNSVGKVTIQNLTPLFSGHLFENEDIEKARKKLDSVDIQEWIWQYASKRGYITSYGVDNTSGMMGTKTKCNDCHYRPPTIPHREHGWIARENEKVSPGVLSGFCDGDHFLHEHILNYTQGFLQETYRAKWAALDINAHHRIEAESINQVDEDLRNFLDNALRYNYNLVVFVLGDHGKPYPKDMSNLGGTYESLLPFLSIIMPSWLLNMRLDIKYNLLVNQQRYLTHRDLHLSMKSLMHFPNMDEVSGFVGEKAVNVFTQEISRKRGCNEAGMPAWSCACGKIKKLEKNEWRIFHTEMVKFVINHINQKHSKKALFKANQGTSMEWNPLHETSCIDINFDKIINIQVREEVDASGQSSTYYHILFQAKEYKTVWLVILDNKWEIHQLSQVTRYNKFYPCGDKLVRLEFCVCDVNKGLPN
ncbi:uncharacterized protein LOC117105032 isoform X2 [Anneissia japonica]|nr:uncharacterized protein LOC117105032 isoform X2 [Anneissia japonica]